MATAAAKRMRVLYPVMVFSIAQMISEPKDRPRPEEAWAGFYELSKAKPVYHE